MKKEPIEIAVLVNSCDAYSDLWEYYFYFVNRYWTTCPYQFYMNTEMLQCNFSTNIGKVITLNMSKKRKWSGRFLAALDKIKENYVIVMCEDSFFFDKVRQDLLLDCEEMVKKDPSIGCISFDQHIPDPFSLGKHGQQFRQRSLKEAYLATAYCTLWKKTYLKKILRQSESPWEFELFGTIRARHYKEKQMVVNQGMPLVFPFEVKGNSGCGVSGGKWTKGNIALFAKHGLQCDFEKRGFINWDEVYEEWNRPQKKLTLFQKLAMPFTDPRKFRQKVRPKILKMVSQIDLLGRIRNLFS